VVTRTRIDLVTGDFEETAEVLPGAGFAERMAVLKAGVPADMAGAPARMMRLGCDGCGQAAALDYDNPELPAGWSCDDEGDWCPACTSGRRTQ
jgi:hypothetical protein